jgi:hypothetical protein
MKYLVKKIQKYVCVKHLKCLAGFSKKNELLYLIKTEKRGGLGVRELVKF